MIPSGLSDLVFKATFLAEQSRTSEISIDLLLAALDVPEIDPASLFPATTGSQSGSYAVNSAWHALSADAAKALSQFTEGETLDRDALRRALLDAKQK